MKEIILWFYINIKFMLHAFRRHFGLARLFTSYDSKLLIAVCCECNTIIWKRKDVFIKNIDKLKE